MSALLSPEARLALYAGNMTWHGMAFYNFVFRPEVMLKVFSKGAATKATMNAQHHDIMRYLGGMNLACVVVAALRLLAVYRLRKAKKITPENSKVDQALDKLAFASLLAGNASQAALNFTVARRSGRWVMGHGFDSITVFDALFTVLDGAALVARARRV